MLMPWRRSTSASKSRKGRFSCSATARPAVVFPAPGKPTRIKCGFAGSAMSAAETGRDVRKVGIVVAPEFGEGVTAELLDECIGKYERGHRLGDDTHRRHGGHVAAFGGRFGARAGLRVDRAQRSHQGADGLHRDANDEWLAGRHPTLETAGAVRLSAHVAGARAVRRHLDLVV